MKKALFIASGFFAGAFAVVSCGQMLPAQAPGGGFSETDADALYLRLDGANDPVAANIEFRHVYPDVANVYDLGANSLPWDDLFIRRIQNSSANAVTIPRIDNDGSSVQLDDHLEPDADSAVDLGTSSVAFRTAYVDAIDGTAAIELGQDLNCDTDNGCALGTGGDGSGATADEFQFQSSHIQNMFTRRQQIVCDDTGDASQSTCDASGMECGAIAVTCNDNDGCDFDISGSPPVPTNATTGPSTRDGCAFFISFSGPSDAGRDIDVAGFSGVVLGTVQSGATTKYASGWFVGGGWTFTTAAVP